MDAVFCSFPIFGVITRKLGDKFVDLCQVYVNPMSPEADPDKNMTFSKPIMTDMPRPSPGNAQEIDFSVLGV